MTETAATSYKPPVSRVSNDQLGRLLALANTILQGSNEPLLKERHAALHRLQNQGLPKPTDEAWRFSQWSDSLLPDFDPYPAQPSAEVLEECALLLNSSPLATAESYLFVFVDGWFAPALSTPPVALPSGLSVERLVDVLQRMTFPQPTIRSAADRSYHPFLELNRLYLQDGLVVVIDSGVKAELPIRISHIYTGKNPGSAAHVRHIIRLGDASKVQILSEHLTLGPSPGWANVAWGILVGRSTTAEHIHLLLNHSTGFHMEVFSCDLHEKARWNFHSLAMASRFARLELSARLAEPQAQTMINGLALVDDERALDHQLFIDHEAPNCMSRQFFNGIMLGKGYGLFHGLIMVRPGAQHTDAYQQSRSLLLSPTARAYSQPQLEIYADDVRCTHGATVGHLDPDALFYLEARGVPPAAAQRLLIHAFAEQVLDRIEYQEAVTNLRQWLWDRINRIPEAQL